MHALSMKILGVEGSIAIAQQYMIAFTRNTPMWEISLLRTKERAPSHVQSCHVTSVTYS